jgi:heptosyltransferase-2
MPRLLLVKLGAIGDVVMAIPAAHAMHQAGYEIHWICGKTVAPILSLYPWINLIPVDETALLRSGKIKTLRALLSLWRKLPAGRFDICATLYYDSRYKLLTLPIRAGRKIFLTHTSRATQLIPGRHHTDEYARILSNRPDDVTPHQLTPIPVSDSLLAQNLTALSSFEPIAPPTPNKPRIVLIPAGARNLLRDDALRRWPIENYVTLAAALLQSGHEVILSGGPDDTWASPHFTHLPVTDLIGKHSLLETLALLNSAAVTVTHDTGPLHLAGITSTAIVAIFGPTDPRGRLPQRADTVALWGGEGYACRPCYDGRDYAPCTNNGCMQQITPAMALGEIQTLLTARKESRELAPRIRTPKHTPFAKLSV